MPEELSENSRQKTLEPSVPGCEEYQLPKQLWWQKVLDDMKSGNVLGRTLDQQPGVWVPAHALPPAGHVTLNKCPKFSRVRLQTYKNIGTRAKHNDIQSYRQLWHFDSGSGKVGSSQAGKSLWVSLWRNKWDNSRLKNNTTPMSQICGNVNNKISDDSNGI